MGELKPVGSEKLTGDAKLNRILELAYYKSSSESKKSPEVIKETKMGVYGIVQEKDGFYVKQGPNEKSLDYIGGLFMKNKNKFPSYAEAWKKLEFLAEQELLQEAKKYVLKPPMPQSEAPVANPTNEPPIPAAVPGDETPPPAGEELPPPSTDELGGEETPSPEGVEDYLKVIQKLSGKLGEKLRSYEEKLESDDIKYVLNMVISAVNLDKLEEADKEEILDKLDPDEDASETSPETEIPSEAGDTTPPAESDIGETDGQAALEELIDTSFFEDDPSSEPYGDDDDNDEDFDFKAVDDAEKAAKLAAQQDLEKEFSDEEVSDIPSDDNFDLEKHKGKEEAAEQSGAIPYEDTMSSEEEKVKELDIDELTNMVNTSVKETLGKYFSE